MNPRLMVRLYAGEAFTDEKHCLSTLMVNEAYTPYVRLSAQFAASEEDYGEITEVAFYYQGSRVFLGMLESLTVSERDGARILTVTARSFTWVLTQNQFVPGMHYNMTLQQIMEGVYQFPGVQYENYEGEGYLYVNHGASVWDSVVNFGYRLTGHYPYIQGNTVRITVDENAQHHEFTDSDVLETGEKQDNSRLVSHFHMADLEGNYETYSLTNEAAVTAGIIRHRQLKMDQQFLSEPMKALEYRSQFCMRGCRERYMICRGFYNAPVGTRISYGDWMINAVVCRCELHFGQDGLYTKYSVYDDGFYSF